MLLVVSQKLLIQIIIKEFEKDHLLITSLYLYSRAHDVIIVIVAEDVIMPSCYTIEAHGSCCHYCVSIGTR